MRDTDPLNVLLRKWRSPEPTAKLDQRVLSAYLSAVRPERTSPDAWHRFWTMRVSVPAPALALAALLIFVWFCLRRAPAAPVIAPELSGAVTRLSISGFQPLPNGDARIVPAMEVAK